MQGPVKEGKWVCVISDLANKRSEMRDPMGWPFLPAWQLISQSCWSTRVFLAVKSGLVVGVRGRGGWEEVHFSEKVHSFTVIIWPIKWVNLWGALSGPAHSWCSLVLLAEKCAAQRLRLGILGPFLVHLSGRLFHFFLFTRFSWQSRNVARSVKIGTLFPLRSRPHFVPLTYLFSNLVLFLFRPYF